MIDVTRDDLLTLTAATKLLPPVDGKHRHPSTLFRWMTRGIRGVRLEHVRLGRRMLTTSDALARFARDAASLDDRPVPMPPVTCPQDESQRRRAIEAAERQLTVEASRREGVR